MDAERRGQRPSQARAESQKASHRNAFHDEESVRMLRSTASRTPRKTCGQPGPRGVQNALQKSIPTSGYASILPPSWRSPSEKANDCSWKGSRAAAQRARAANSRRKRRNYHSTICLLRLGVNADRIRRSVRELPSPRSYRSSECVSRTAMNRQPSMRFSLPTRYTGVRRLVVQTPNGSAKSFHSEMPFSFDPNFRDGKDNATVPSFV